MIDEAAGDGKRCEAAPEDNVYCNDAPMTARDTEGKRRNNTYTKNAKDKGLWRDLTGYN